MMKLVSSVLAASLVAFLVTPATVARAGDPGCNDRTDQCEIVIVDPGARSDPTPGDPGPAPRKKVVPSCVGLGVGVIAPVGSSLADLGLDDAMNRPGVSGDSNPWEGWSYVREHVEEVSG